VRSGGWGGGVGEGGGTKLFSLCKRTKFFIFISFFNIGPWCWWRDVVAPVRRRGRGGSRTKQSFYIFCIYLYLFVFICIYLYLFVFICIYLYLFVFI
jgi:hypothetical protein